MEIYLYNDVAFKWMFGRQERTKPIVSLLNAVIGYESSETLFKEIRILTYPSTEATRWGYLTCG